MKKSAAGTRNAAIPNHSKNADERYAPTRPHAFATAADDAVKKDGSVG
jgi:hypothetical protein